MSHCSNHFPYEVRSFLVATQYRDKTRFPHPSSFNFDLPLVLNNVIGINFRDYHFGKETFINENNKMMELNIDGSTTANIVLTKGNYATITAFLEELNTQLFNYDVRFTIDEETGKVTLAFTETFAGNYVIFPYNNVLRNLGYNGSICLYTGSAPNVTTATLFANTATAENLYDIWKPAHMIVRITDVETILSNDPVTSRCTAVLFDTSSSTHASKQMVDTYIPLLQIQSRLQTLRIQLLNMDGDLYDTIQNDATFVIDLYCRK